VVANHGPLYYEFLIGQGKIETVEPLFVPLCPISFRTFPEMFPSISNPSVRTVTDTIRIGDTTFQLSDRSLKGIDDAVYEKHRDVWEMLPRGNAVFAVNGAVVHRVAGLRKFGYNDASYGNKAAVTSAVLITKENGECAHIAAFRHSGVNYWVAGSKNVHIVWPDGKFEAMQELYTAPRYKYALRIASVWDAMIDNDTFDAEMFHLHLTKTGLTVCAEAILAESEHIVNYDEKDTLLFYALVNPTAPSSAGLTAESPHEAERIFKTFGLPTAAVSQTYAFPSAAYDAALEQVARRMNSEGVVVYGLDSDGRVCCMWKEKSYPYVMERVLREQVTHGRTLQQIYARVHLRLSQQVPAVRAYFSTWEQVRLPWLLAFAAWLQQTGVVPVKNAWDVQCRWLTLQDTFRAVPSEILSRAYDACAAIHTPECAQQTVIQLVGLPGSGKSTLARSLFHVLKQAGQTPRWLNQDEADSNRGKYIGAIKTAMADPSTTHIILDKSNLALENRKDYADLGLLPTLTVVFHHPDGANALKAVCLERFQARGPAHRSLRSAGADAVSPAKFNEICDNMLSKYVVPTADADDILSVDVRDEPAAILKAVAEKLALDVSSVSAALEFATAYEAVVHAIKRPAYGGISIAAADMKDVFELMGPLGDKFPKKEFHITTKYLGSEMDPMWFLDAIKRLGRSESVTITEIVYDDKGAAARVVGDFACCNAHPHITLALAKGVQATYSNTLLESEHAQRISVHIPLTGKHFFG